MSLLKRLKKLKRGIEMELPKEVKIPMGIMTDDADGDCGAVADYLSDNYGFCVTSLSVENGIATDIVLDIKD